MYLIGVRIGSYIFFGDNADAMVRTKKLARTRVWALCLFFWYEDGVLSHHLLLYHLEGYTKFYIFLLHVATGC